MILQFNKSPNGLLPVIIQDNASFQVLMLGYMNEAAYFKTLEEKKVTFFSRSKNRLWTKGETSGNFLWMEKMYYDCDQDAILIIVKPSGPVCHIGTKSCFNFEQNERFIFQLEKIIHKRIDENTTNSYTNQLYQKGINKIAQKVGEEAVELVIEAKDNNDNLFKNEAADLLYHFIVLLKAKGFTLKDIEDTLVSRA